MASSLYPSSTIEDNECLDFLLRLQELDGTCAWSEDMHVTTDALQVGQPVFAPDHATASAGDDDLLMKGSPEELGGGTPSSHHQYQYHGHRSSRSSSSSPSSSSSSSSSHNIHINNRSSSSSTTTTTTAAAAAAGDAFALEGLYPENKAFSSPYDPVLPYWPDGYTEMPESGAMDFDPLPDFVWIGGDGGGGGGSGGVGGTGLVSRDQNMDLLAPADVIPATTPETAEIGQAQTTTQRARAKFTRYEDELIVRLRNDHKTWKEIAKELPGRSPGGLQVRYSTKLKMRPVDWTSALDCRLMQALSEYEQRKWEVIATQVGSGLSSEACRERALGRIGANLGLPDLS